MDVEGEEAPKQLFPDISDDRFAEIISRKKEFAYIRYDGQYDPNMSLEDQIKSRQKNTRGNGTDMFRFHSHHLFGLNYL